MKIHSRNPGAVRSSARVMPAVLAGMFCLPLSVDALETARMELPEGFRAEAVAVPFSGFGGFNRGNWSAETYSGEFTRSESRLGIFDPLFASNNGKSSFTFPLANASAPLSVTCEMGRKSVTIGIVTFDPRKMRYACDFRTAGGLLGDRLLLGQPKPASMKERLIAQDRRLGEASIGGLQISMASVHRYEGSPFSSQAPVGYLLESAGVTLAAVELTDWNPLLYLKPDLPVEDREAVMIVALALSVLRDPANSALEE